MKQSSVGNDIDKALTYVREQIELADMCDDSGMTEGGLAREYRRIEVLLMKLERLEAVAQMETDLRKYQDEEYKRLRGENHE